MNAALAVSYDTCRALHRSHGRTYYLATRLLPAWKRQHVHALYGFTRYTDEIVDRMDATDPLVRADQLRAWSAQFFAGLNGARSTDPVLPAVLDTIEAFDLDIADFEKFLDSMARDLTVDSYADYDDVLDYMEGSAAVIGTMMVPILGTSDRDAAREPARQLGFAFQLTNFIRDVAEDYARGRIYLPQSDLDAFEVRPDDLGRATATDSVRELIRFEIARARDHYRAAEPGIALLDPTSQPCIRAAFVLYSEILDMVERLNYDVLARRARVSIRRRASVAARESVHVVRSRWVNRGSRIA